MNASAIENYIPLPQAAKRLKITAIALKRLIDSGKIHAVRLGETVAVPESELNQTIFREQFEDLRGQEITIAQAVEKYQIEQMTIRRWIDRGYIKVLKDGYGMHIDLADVAYCAAVYQTLGGTRGKRLFNDDGQPYRPKLTNWAIYQRERRKKKKTEPLS